MPSYKDAFPSKWLKAEGCNPPLILEIKSMGFEDVGSGTDIKRKLCAFFVEIPQGWVLNKTNADLLCAMFGTDDYLEWVGSKVCLGSVKVPFQGKIVDAIRVLPMPARKTRPLATRKPTPPPPPEEEDESDTEVGF